MATATAPLATQLEELSSDEILRYSRHLILPEVALEGQQRLKASRVLLIVLPSIWMATRLGFQLVDI